MPRPLDGVVYFGASGLSGKIPYLALWGTLDAGEIRLWWES